MRATTYPVEGCLCHLEAWDQNQPLYCEWPRIEMEIAFRPCERIEDGEFLRARYVEDHCLVTESKDRVRGEILHTRFIMAPIDKGHPVRWHWGTRE